MASFPVGTPGGGRIFGYRSQEAFGSPIIIVIPHDRYDEENSILKRLSTGKRLNHFETVRLTKDGRRIDVSPTESPIKDGEGKIIGISRVARDITELKQNVEQNLLQNQPDMKCLYMSGYTVDIINKQGEIQDRMSFLQKQFSKYELATSVRTTLDGFNKEHFLFTLPDAVIGKIVSFIMRLVKFSVYSIVDAFFQIKNLPTVLHGSLEKNGRRQALE